MVEISELYPFYITFSDLEHKSKSEQCQTFAAIEMFISYKLLNDWVQTAYLY